MLECDSGPVAGINMEVIIDGIFRFQRRVRILPGVFDLTLVKTGVQRVSAGIPVEPV